MLKRLKSFFTKPVTEELAFFKVWHLAALVAATLFVLTCAARADETLAPPMNVQIIAVGPVDEPEVPEGYRVVFFIPGAAGVNCSGEFVPFESTDPKGFGCAQEIED